MNRALRIQACEVGKGRLGRDEDKKTLMGKEEKLEEGDRADSEMICCDKARGSLFHLFRSGEGGQNSCSSSVHALAEAEPRARP